MTKTTTLFAMATLFLSACDILGGGWDGLLDSDDTGSTGDFFDGELLINELNYGCDVGSPDTWWFESTSQGWAGDTTLSIYETGDGNWPGNPSAVWDELHNMTNTESAENGDWDFWTLSLADVDSAGSQVAGRSTLFSCQWNDGGSLAFKATLYDEDGRETDCAIWGYQSEQYFNDYRNNSCVCFDGDGSCTN